KEAIKRRVHHEPLQYILGKTEFYGYNFIVDPSVLIPRPETEYLVEKVIEDCADARSILEIGTGSGCIAITLAKEMNNIEIDAVDLYPEALKTAALNCEKNNAEVNFLQSDIFSNIAKKYDAIISNPPYISEKAYVDLSDEIKYFEPATALLAGEDGLYFYRQILKDAGNFLKDNGKIYLEIGHDQAEAIKLIAEKYGFTNIEIIKDLNGFDRIMIIG
ncbi:peptide chain release factor N(5)-glutamine methyltransferase, partial [Candidatus Cloacimonadota bacterium]